MLRIAQDTWYDLESPTEAERAQVTQATGLRLPDRHDIAGIESSSRLANEAGVLFLSTPMLSRGADGTVVAAPVGFVVSRERLVTLRFASSTVFDSFAATWRQRSRTPSTMRSAGSPAARARPRSPRVPPPRCRLRHG